MLLRNFVFNTLFTRSFIVHIVFYWCNCINSRFYNAVFVNVRVGAKYHKASDAVRVILRDGTLKPLSAPSNVTELSEEGQEMCQYVSEVS